jgi:protein-tyrosine phosphatase
MFAGLLARDLAAIGSPFEVHSAGLLEWDEPVDPAAVAAMVAHGVDISGHRSRPVMSLDLSGFDLILTMTREHVREVVIGDPGLFPITFTAKSFARALGEPRSGALPADIRGRIRTLSEGRSPSTLLGQSPDDDVDDPYQLGQQAFDATSTELAELSSRISLGLRSLSA